MDAAVIGIRDPYEVLGVARDAGAAAIKAAYRNLAKKHHPDTSSEPSAQARFAQLNSAHEIIGDEDKRQQFDRGEIDADGKPCRAKVSLTPPDQIAKSVLVHRRNLEIERDHLRDGAAELALKSAKGDTAAQAELAAIPARYAALTLEIDMNAAAHGLAIHEDQLAMAAWRASFQTLSAEELIEGIGKDSCCRRCMPGLSCVITASYPYAAAQCGHPIKELQTIYGRDAVGDRKFLFAGKSPKAEEVFEAARRRLKVNER